MLGLRIPGQPYPARILPSYQIFPVVYVELNPALTRQPVCGLLHKNRPNQIENLQLRLPDDTILKNANNNPQKQNHRSHTAYQSAS